MKKLLVLAAIFLSGAASADLTDVQKHQVYDCKLSASRAPTEAGVKLALSVCNDQAADMKKQSAQGKEDQFPDFNSKAIRAAVEQSVKSTGGVAKPPQ